MNGNMTRDDYKAVSISYNSFNLPSELDFGNNKKLSSSYDGSGRKLTNLSFLHLMKIENIFTVGAKK